MKKFTMKAIALLLSFSLLLPFSFVALASPIEPPTGNKLVEGALTVTLSDGTNGAFSGEVALVITDIAAGYMYDYSLSVGKTVTDTIVANTTYIAVFIFDDGDYSVCERNGDPVSRFAMTAQGYNADWIVMNKDEGNNDTAAVGVPQGGGATGDSVRNEGLAMYARFIDVIGFIESDPRYDNLFDAVFPLEVNSYVNFAGGNEDDWEAMSRYDRYMIFCTYLYPMKMLSLGNYSRYFDSIQTFNNNVIGINYRLIKSVVGDDEAEAFKELMAWQYEYFKGHNNAFFDFTTGINSTEYKNGIRPGDLLPVEQPGNTGDNAQDEAVQGGDGQGKETPDSEVKTPVPATAAPTPAAPVTPEAEQKKGIWDDTIKKLKGSSLTIIILVIVAAALAGVIIYNKKRDIKDVEKG